MIRNTATAMVRLPGSIRRLPADISQNRKTLLIAAVALLLAFGWTQNTFDNFLWRVHLNHSDCIQNGFGAVFCGDAAKRYEKQFSR
jgi:hypothetical protein